MPAGPGPIVFAYFLGVKFVGYTAFCHWVVNARMVRAEMASDRTGNNGGVGLRSGVDQSPNLLPTVPSAVKAGVVRTLIGLGVGVAVGLGFWAIPFFSRHDTAGAVMFFSLLVPVRVGEWSLLFWWVYGMRPFSDVLGFRLITPGLLVRGGFYCP